MALRLKKKKKVFLFFPFFEKNITVVFFFLSPLMLDVKFNKSLWPNAT